MNGLSLRITGSAVKTKPTGLGVAPIAFTEIIKEQICSNGEGYAAFVRSSTSDDQLTALKKIITNLHSYNEDFITFITHAYLESGCKHPIKGFLTRYVTKTSTIQADFAATLALEIKKKIERASSEVSLGRYCNTVTTIISCSENFPTGVAAIKSIEVLLIDHLSEVLEWSTVELRKNEVLSPTEKNDIFNLIHLTLRAILNIVQRVNLENKDHMIEKCVICELCLDYLFTNSDVPMDSKTVGGILYLNMHILKHGPLSWTDILQDDQTMCGLSCFSSCETVELSLTAAIVIVVSPMDLQTVDIDGVPSLRVLSEKILNICERNTSDSSFVLCVTRTFVQLCKMLERLDDAGLGQMLVELYLTFVWAHLDHYMDSVRHLTAQALHAIVKYCTKLYKQGDSTALNSTFDAILSLSSTRKAYFVSLTALTQELGASRVLDRIPRAIHMLMQALDLQAVQASATTTLEAVLQSHAKEVDTSALCQHWITPILQHISSNNLESSVLNILENLLAKAVKLDNDIVDFIMPYINLTDLASTTIDSQAGEFKCVLILLSVARKCGVIRTVSGTDSELWKGIIEYKMLKKAAIDYSDETRLLSLSLIVETPKSTEELEEGDFDFVLYFLRYNINAQSPNFRQQMLSFLKKLIKRLDESYKVLQRGKESEENSCKLAYYWSFVRRLRELCFDSLVPGANYSRRCVALQALVWCEQLQWTGFSREWKQQYANKLVTHLDNSYENNKGYALRVLEHCPQQLLTNADTAIGINMEDIFRQASSVKPTDCTSAAYKFNLVKMNLSSGAIDGMLSDMPEAAGYCLISSQLQRLRQELDMARVSILVAASQAPMYGLLHCMCHLVKQVDCVATASSDHWTCLINDLINICIQINEVVSPVVNNSSPEGHLPMDFEPGSSHLEGNGLVLENGTKVTAQMVLLCAWRSVKEVSLLLGEISSRFAIQRESSSSGNEAGNLTEAQLLVIGEHFTTLLTETKHRGAFEQAYVGFTKLLTRLWRSVSPSLHGVPPRWLSALLTLIVSREATALCGTRRGAGLPFMIQALVTTELQVTSNPVCFHSCMATLLRLARSGGEGETDVETRVHSVNILRALFRHTALGDCVSGYVGEGLLTALKGFDGSTWSERNAATLLLSTLVVRVFGVQRGRDWDNLPLRNKMTGRIFFLRYPQLYDYMLDKFREALEDAEELVRPSLFPTLVLLSRLYPSSLEGSVSNLKLVAFIPHVVACAASAVLKTRHLAAKAVVPLISPGRYLPHLEAMFTIISNSNIKRNYCHGILLQILKLLEARPEELFIDMDTSQRFVQHLNRSVWILSQGLAERPCYLLIDEYVKVVNLLIWRFPLLINDEVTIVMEEILEKILRQETPAFCYSGRSVCLANVLCLYIIMVAKCDQKILTEAIVKALQHPCDEVVLATMNYILVLHGEDEGQVLDNFQESLLGTVDKGTVLKGLSSHPRYAKTLCYIMNCNSYMECQQRSLAILSLEEDCQRAIVEVKSDEEIDDDDVIARLIGCVKHEHDSMTHIYLKSLLKFVSAKVRSECVGDAVMLQVVRAVYNCGTCDHDVRTRRVVGQFLLDHCVDLIDWRFDTLCAAEHFEYKATFWAIIVTLLEDDEASIRQLATSVVGKLSNEPSVCRTIPCRAGEVLRDTVLSRHSSTSREREGHTSDSIAVLLVIALLHFNAEVCITDDLSEECRVFDQNEKYNIFLEETVWSIECMMRILKLFGKASPEELRVKVFDVLNNLVYRRTFEVLCSDNLKAFQVLLDGQSGVNELVNPKLGVIVDMLR